MDTRTNVLAKLRRYSNGVAAITEQLLNEEITEQEAEKRLIALDEHFANRLLSILSV